MRDTNFKIDFPSAFFSSSSFAISVALIDFVRLFIVDREHFGTESIEFIVSLIFSRIHPYAHSIAYAGPDRIIHFGLR